MRFGEGGCATALRQPLRYVAPPGILQHSLRQNDRSSRYAEFAAAKGFSRKNFCLNKYSVSSSELAISVHDLSKSYVISHKGERHTTLAEALVHRLRHPFRRPNRETFWALRDLSLDIHQGEVVGLIGRNGAGKSTLLKIVSRVTRPSGGCIELYGRVGSLLEVGSGFHPELTGRENIYLNGQILGMRRKEIDRQFDAIVAFADVEKFLDTPVKRYSSGMFVRLAFAVAAHLDAEILVVDEVLAVGDLEFQKKCLGKMSSVARGGRTVIFVSHNMLAIGSLCSKAAVLSNGMLDFYGPTTEAIAHYTDHVDQRRKTNWERDPSDDTPPLTIRTVSVELGGEQPSHTLAVSVELESVSPHKPAFLAVDVLDRAGVTFMQAIPTLERFITDSRRRHEVEVEIELPPLVPGCYSLSVWVGSHFSEDMDWVKEVVSFEIEQSPTSGRTFPHSSGCGPIVPISRLVHSPVPLVGGS